MCRAIVRPKLKRDREGNGKKGGDGPSSAAEVEVLNIWEAGWEDVEYVKGIVNV